MTDTFTEEQRSECMKKVNSSDTEPEVKLRKTLWNNGLKGYRKNYDITGKPDIVFTKYNLAIFVDGCFWHKCPSCFRKPKSNLDYWEPKIENNVERDIEVNNKLKEKGWEVLRIWEHQIKEDINSVVDLIETKIKKRKKQEVFKFIDLFAGIGGFRLALENKGHNCVYSSEWDEYAQKTYRANFGELPEGDIKEIDESDIPKHNILCAGFPCQAFSISGKRLGFEDTRGTLFFDIARIAKQKQPEVLFLENVSHLKRHEGGDTLKIIEDTLDKIGYTVFHKVLNASHYGAPTSRKRIYFACFKKDLDVNDFSFPDPIEKDVKLEDCLVPNEEAQEFIIERDDIKLRENVEIERDLNGNLPNKPIRVGKINKGGQGERIYSPLGHAITFSANGGGAASKTGGYLIDGKVRKLTPKECAKVMGFPKWFKIPVSSSKAHKQFGNSVAVPVIKEVFKKIEDKLLTK